MYPGLAEASKAVLLFQHVKVFIQSKATRLYLSGNDKWTADPDEARDFRSSLKAMDFLQQFKQEQSHIILKFGDPKYD
ncbi:MAG TPA: hypothetical protein VFB72_15930, partial [Verrucomicrobiae bacterium]|nr:hypothetical protein [Verrucomicrobiae bacterium]